MNVFNSHPLSFISVLVIKNVERKKLLGASWFSCNKKWNRKKLNNNDNQLFHDRFSERHDAPRTNFDNFLKAMLAVFQVSYVSDVL